jgi:hypothetical protein
MKILMALPLIFLASSIVRADGLGDTHVSNGTGPGGSIACGSVVEFAGPTGILTADCENEGETLITSVTFSVQDSSTIVPGQAPGLLCTSPLTFIGWGKSTSSAGGIDSCTFTAPSTTNKGFILIADLLDGHLGINDGDCDLDDVLVGIPVGCDYTAKTVTNSVFTDNAPVGLSVDGAPLPNLVPEPSSALLLLVGLGAGVPFLRRKSAN